MGSGAVMDHRRKGKVMESVVARRTVLKGGAAAALSGLTVLSVAAFAPTGAEGHPRPSAGVGAGGVSDP